MNLAKLIKPKGESLLFIFLAEFFLSFAFFGTLGILLLFLIEDAGYSQKAAYRLWGNFASLTYIFAFVGGSLGGRLLSFRSLSAMGLVFMAAGYTVLIINYREYEFIVIGLTCIGCGNGLVATNLRNFLGLYYQHDSERHRDDGFTTFHVFNVLGQFLSPLLLSYFRFIHPIALFSAAGVSILLSIISLFISFKVVSINTNKISSKSIRLGLLIIGIGLLFVFFTLYHQKVKYLLEFIFLVSALMLAFILPRMERVKRIKSIAVLIILSGALATDLCLRQLFGTITLFTNVYIDKTFFNINIPATVFEALEPFLIFIAFPIIVEARKLLERKGVNITSGASMSLGFLILALGFGLLVLGTYITQAAKMSVNWLFLFYGVLSFGELLLIPVSTAAVVALSPKEWRGMMMGVFFLLISFASYLNSLVGEWISPLSDTAPAKAAYQALFTYVALFAGIFSLLFYFIWQCWYKKYKQELNQEI